MRELYIYYRVAAGEAAATLGVVLRWQAGLRQRHPSLRARLLKRPLPAGAAAGDTETWMETYAAAAPAAAADDLVARLQDELARGPPNWSEAPAAARHAEVFEPCAS